MTTTNYQRGTWESRERAAVCECDKLDLLFADYVRHWRIVLGVIDETTMKFVKRRPRREKSYPRWYDCTCHHGYRKSLSRRVYAAAAAVVALRLLLFSSLFTSGRWIIKKNSPRFNCYFTKPISFETVDLIKWKFSTWLHAATSQWK